MKWVRGRIIPFFIYVYTHIYLPSGPYESSVRQVMSGQALHARLF